jgi:hypothetical protein
MDLGSLEAEPKQQRVRKKRQKRAEKNIKILVKEIP